MLFRYSQFDAQTFRDINREKLKKLFLELLNKMSGNAQRALMYMQGIWNKNKLDEVTGMSFPEFRDWLEEQGLLETNPQSGVVAATGKADREIQRSAFEEIFRHLNKDSSRGDHPIPMPGTTGERLTNTREFEFGDPVQDINFTQSIANAVKRTGFDDFEMREADLETFESEHTTSVSTVILIDISHSMTLYGEDRITPAKKVAMALTEFIQQKFPKDTIDVVLFGDDAIEVPVEKIARVSNGPFHTNTKAGLQMAQRILMRRKAANKQVFMITDGKPSAIYENGELYRNPFGLDPKIVSQTINEATQLRRKGISITTFMLVSDSYLQDFVDKLTRANKGRAYYATLDDLGSFIFADYAKNKKKRLH